MSVFGILSFVLRLTLACASCVVTAAAIAGEKSPEPSIPPGDVMACADAARAAANMVLWVLWATYGSFYLCRINLAAALPGIEQEFGFTKSEMANVLIALKITYGIGQFINGHLAEELDARKTQPVH